MVITVTFFLVHLTPGDPFATERAMSPTALAALHKNVWYGCICMATVS